MGKLLVRPPAGDALERAASQPGILHQADVPRWSDQNIRDQLDRILTSPEFSVPQRARKLLKYLVDETLAGRADRIKGYSIALEVFGRSDSFDAQHDPVVRIEAGRIRRALERYYLVAGQSDPIVVGIPKGGYVPQFEHRTEVAVQSVPTVQPEISPRAEASGQWRLNWKWLASLAAIIVCVVTVVAFYLGYVYQPAAPVVLDDFAPKVLVTPFSDLGDDATSKTYALGLTAEIVDQLAKFKDIGVIATSPAGAGAKDGSQPPYELTGSVRASGDRLRFIVNLVDRGDGKILWTKAYEDDIDVKTLFAFQKEVAATVATEIGQAYGVIIRANSVRIGQYRPDDTEAYSCMLSYFAYRQDLEPAQHAAVRTCLEKAVKQFPEFATGWALLSLMTLDEERFGYNPLSDKHTAVERALVAALSAVSLDPNNVRAQQALMTSYFFSNNVEMGVKTGRQALALNPNDMELVGEFGVRLATSGQWAEGDALIEKALAYNPSNANYYLTTQSVAAYMQNDYVRATDVIGRITTNNPLARLIAVAIYGQRGMAEEARAASERYFATGSKMHENIDAEMNKRNMPDPDKVHFVEGLLKAGLQVRSAYVNAAGAD